MTIMPQFDTLDAFRERVSTDPEFVAEVNSHRVVIGETTCLVNAEYETVRGNGPGPLYCSLELRILAP